MNQLTPDCRAQLEAIGLWPLVAEALAHAWASRKAMRKALETARASSQLELQFDAPVRKAKMPEAPVPQPAPIQQARARDADEIPIGAVVRTPLGALARVVAYRGGRRMGGGDKDNHERLVCRYINPKNRRWGVVVLRAELVEVVKEEIHGT